MTSLATGVIILSTMAAFAIGLATLSLLGAWGRAEIVLLMPLALAAGAVVTMLLGFTLPWPGLTATAPIVVGVAATLLSRHLGYGLLAGLIVAVTMS
jgi:hypothetical protein